LTGFQLLVNVGWLVILVSYQHILQNVQYRC